MCKSRERPDAPAAEHLFLGAGVEDALEVDQAADEVGTPPHRPAIDQGDVTGAGIDGVNGDIGGRFRTSEHDDLASLRDGGIVVLGRVQNPPALSLESILAGVAYGLRLVELARADRDEVVVLLRNVAVRTAEIHSPTRPRLGTAVHLKNCGVEANQTIDPVVARVVSEIGVNLRPARPFGIRRRHRLVGVAVKVLRALGLQIGIGSRGLPDTADIAAALDNSDLMSPRQERFRRSQPGNAGADDANSLLFNHRLPRGLVSQSARY